MYIWERETSIQDAYHKRFSQYAYKHNATAN